MRYPGENAAARAPGRRQDPSGRATPPGGKAAGDASVFAPGYTGGRAPGRGHAAGEGWRSASSPLGGAAGKGPVRGFPPAPGQAPPLYPPGQFAAWNRTPAPGDNGYDPGLSGPVGGAWQADYPGAPGATYPGGAGAPQASYADAGYSDAGYSDAGYGDAGYLDQGYDVPGYAGPASGHPGYAALAVGGPVTDATTAGTPSGWGQPAAGGPGTDADDQLADGAPGQRAGDDPDDRPATGPQRTATGPQLAATGPQRAATGPFDRAVPAPFDRGATSPDLGVTTGPHQRGGGPGAATGPAHGPGRGQGTRGRGSRGRKRPRGRGRIRALLICGLALIVVAGAAYFYFARVHRPPAPAADSQRATASARPPTRPSPSPSPLGPWGHIGTRALDPAPLTLAELFPASFTNGTTGYIRTVQKAKTHCASALVGSQLVAAVSQAGCTQAMRASYLSSDHKLMGTIGVLNLVTATAAEQAGKAAGPAEFIAQLPAAKGPTKNLTKGTGFEAAEVKGHYLVLVWAEFANLHTPRTAAQGTELKTFISLLMQKTANVSLATRQVTGSPPP